jgi:hypothetical protein
MSLFDLLARDPGGFFDPGSQIRLVGVFVGFEPVIGDLRGDVAGVIELAVLIGTAWICSATSPLPRASDW